MRRTFWTAAGLVVLGAVTAMASVLWPVVSANRAPESLVPDRPLRVGYAIEAPFAFLDAQGQVTGESPQTLRVALQAMGITQVEWRHVEFSRLMHELAMGRIDVIASGLFVTPQRREHLLFTRPTVGSAMGLMVHAGNPLGLRQLEDVAKASSARLAVVAGSVEVDHARRAGVPDERVVSWPDAHSAMAAVRGGRAEALALSSASLRMAVTGPSGEGLSLVDDVGVAGSVVRGWPALAFRSQDQALRDRVDAELGRYLGTEAHVAMVRRFGFTPDDVQAALARSKETP